ncbi:hypothetical protein N7456_001396 [Penicillium angulare]|uniref:1-alkyl-2-acetylglycerophosphocholine esterase n=1 Tax=Penicillium angulare TaxID=116970 RepID=A0A9W9KP93_9EURO|nr:hypothetical protein N7456_001396 [Penicillium angulare]
MAPLLSFAALLLSLLPAATDALCTNTTVVSLPPPEGPYVSSITVQTLTDRSRLNPFNVSDARSPYRQLVVSYYEPYQKESCALIGDIDYMTAGVAEFFNAANLPLPDMTTFSQMKLSGVCLEPHGQVADAPLLLFSGGFWTSRQEYGALVQRISSWGYRVVLIDHPYDASVVQFPEGDIVYSYYASDIPTDAISQFVQDIRVKDIPFVAKTFGQPGEKIGFYGHSLGASCETAVLQNDTTDTFIAALNLDGKLVGNTGDLGLGVAGSPARSYMFIGHDNHTVPSEPSWVALWNTTAQLTPDDARVAVDIPGTIHNSFNDLPLVIETAGVRSINESYFTTLIGTKNGLREVQDISAYAREFFDWTMKGNATHPLLDGPNPEFPDVVYGQKAGF